jgi:MYXO-CTERM domain-containing protein
MRWLSSSAVLGLAMLTARGALAQSATDPYLGFEGHIFDAGDIKLPYRLAPPAPYDAAKKYPLVIFLHGSGESGTDNKAQISKNIGVPTGGSVFQGKPTYANFFVAPQAPVGSRDGWMGVPGQAVLKLIAALEQQYVSIDTDRLYITGLSMGGYGTWALIEDHPKMFACAVPMSAGGDVTKAAAIAPMPIWDFHGTVDQSVPVQESRDMIAALQAAGGTPKYTEYPNGGHAIWDQAYNEPELLPWMFGQRLAPADAGAAGVDDSGTGGGDARANQAVDAGTSAEGGSSMIVEDAAASPPVADDAGSAVEPALASTDDGANGCSCSVASTQSASPQAGALALLAISHLRRRRRLRS